MWTFPDHLPVVESRHMSLPTRRRPTMPRVPRYNTWWSVDRYFAVLSYMIPGPVADSARGSVATIRV